MGVKPVPDRDNGTPRYRLKECQHPKAWGGRPGKWFILPVGDGDTEADEGRCHEGVAYPTRDEAAETARLLAWVGAAAHNYRDEVVPQAAAGSSRQRSGPDL